MISFSSLLYSPPCLQRSNYCKVLFQMLRCRVTTGFSSSRSSSSADSVRVVRPNAALYFLWFNEAEATVCSSALDRFFWHAVPKVSFFHPTTDLNWMLR